MKFAVLGCRHLHIGDAVKELLAMGHEGLGVYEAHGTLAARLMEAHRLPAIESEEALFALRPDMVLCAAVNSEKIDVIEKCCARGIPVMLDKPLVTCMQDYARLDAAAKLPGAHIGMMLTERFNPPVRALKAQIDSGAIGEIVGMVFIKPHKLNAPSREAWHFDKHQNGGLVIDLLVHDMDLARWLTGSEIESVSGYVKAGDCADYPDMWDDAKVLVRMESGVTCAMMSDWWTPGGYACYGDGRILVTGTRGACEVYTTGAPGLHDAPFLTLTTADAPRVILEGLPPEKTLMQDFMDRIEGRASVIGTDDILAATYATLRADQRVEVIERGK